MNNYIPTKKELYTSIGGLCLGLLILSFSIFALLSKISSIKTEARESKTDKLSTEETFLIKKDLSLWQEEIKLLDSFFIGADGEVAFIEKIEAVSKRAGVKSEINSIQIGKKATSSEMVENLNIEIIFEGEWASATDFLVALENLPYALSLGGVELNRMGKSLWRGKVNLTVLKIKDA